MKIYDMENHFYSQATLEFLAGRSEYPYMKSNGDILYRDGAFLPVGGHSFNYPKDVDIRAIDEVKDLGDLRLAAMDKAGVTTVLISSGGLIEELSREDAVRLARATNDAVAEACRQHPGRFMGTICLPTPYVEDSLKELERAVKELGLKYWHTHSNYGD